jgi:hypothetical protein
VGDEHALLEPSLERLLLEAGSQLGCDIELVDEPVAAEASPCLYVPVRGDDGRLLGTLLCAGGQLGERDVRALQFLAGAIADLGDEGARAFRTFRAAFFVAVAGLAACLAFAIAVEALVP